MIIARYCTEVIKSPNWMNVFHYLQLLHTVHYMYAGTNVYRWAWCTTTSNICLVFNGKTAYSPVVFLLDSKLFFTKFQKQKNHKKKQQKPNALVLSHLCTVLSQAPHSKLWREGKLLTRGFFDICWVDCVV